MQPEFFKPEKITKGWGWEQVIENNKEFGFCGKILHYNRADNISSYHFHPIKCEVFTCIAGKFRLYWADEKGNKIHQDLNLGDCVRLRPSTPHQLQPLEDGSEILEVSTYHDDADVVRIAPGDSQKMV